MVRDSIEVLRSPATSRRGQIPPVWNGDETKWALASCLLGHSRYVSFPGVTAPRPRRHPLTARSCRPSRSSPRPQVPNQAATEMRLGQPPETCAGFSSIRRRPRRRPAREWMSTRCRQASTRWGRGRSRGPDRSTSRMRCSNRYRASSSAIRPAIHFSRTYSFAVLSHPPSPVRPRDSRSTRTGCASTKRSAIPSTGI